MNLSKIPFPKVGFNPPKYICRKAVMEKPEIDGNIFKPFWDNAFWTQPFSDIEGDTRPKPAKETKAKFLWDDEYLYMAAILYDDQIWANMREHDDIVFFDNDFELFIDWKNTTHSYFEMEMNARNVLWDLLLTKPYRDGGIPVDGFDMKGIKTAVLIDGELNNPNADNKSWSVEMAIPWACFAERKERAKPPKTGDYFRINLSRVEWRVTAENGKYEKVINPETNNPYPEDNWVYSPTGVINIHYPELWSFLVFADEDAADEFTIPEVEYIKWELRNVYYLQRELYGDTGKFSANVPYFEQKFKFSRTPVIEITSDMFQAYMFTADGKTKVNICQDGYTWIDTKANN